ncbi:MAG: hypothetical protein K6G70_08510 [Bacteroidaceae bacterium]|nr:hypothetical protein [Bacteroidaceae bacterium]
MRLLYFNPENDLALAANDPHYTPPASALQMATDLQRLPLRWAEEGDQILLREPHGRPTPLPLPCREGSNFSSNIDRVSACQTDSTPFPTREGQGGGSIPFPWGWSPLTVTDFLRAGVPAELLPTDAEMQAFRTLAGRATAAEVLRHVRERLTAEGYGDCLTGEAYVCRSLDEARRWHERFGESIFKQPWSGSGRGLLPAHDGVLTEKNEAWLQRTLRQQGYVMAEPFYHRRTDLALEFWRHADDGRVTYEGLSLFMTTAGGVYAGNIVASEEQKRQFLANIFPSAEEAAEGLALLDATREALIAELSALPPTFYDGPLGVDMMFITPHSSSVILEVSSVPSGRARHSSFSSPRLLLHPCVEINFRMTMGWLALHV